MSNLEVESIRYVSHCDHAGFPVNADNSVRQSSLSSECTCFVDRQPDVVGMGRTGGDQKDRGEIKTPMMNCILVYQRPKRRSAAASSPTQNPEVSSSRSMAKTFDPATSGSKRSRVSNKQNRARIERRGRTRQQLRQSQSADRDQEAASAALPQPTLIPVDHVIWNCVTFLADLNEVQIFVP